MSSPTDLALMIEAVLRKRYLAMRRNGELGGGGPSVENVWLLIGGVAIAVGVLAWVGIKVLGKQETLSP